MGESQTKEDAGVSAKKIILLTGATGYVGGRLLPLLERRGLRVRCLTRRLENLTARVAESTEFVPGDVLDPESPVAALSGVDTAYYFVHSMGTRRDFAQEDRDAASNFAKAAGKAGVRKIIHLGGLGNRAENLSKHLRSRQETGNILRASKAQVVEFRASIVIGSGSLSFELIRALVERLPVMICPRWVGVKARQTAIFDPLGLFGLVYWYALFPLHLFIYAGMLRNIAWAAETPPRDPNSQTSGRRTQPAPVEAT